MDRVAAMLLLLGAFVVSFFCSMIRWETMMHVVQYILTDKLYESISSPIFNIQIAVLFMLALFSVAPIFCSCLAALMYILYYFIANETSGMHHAQEFENRFWTIFAFLLTAACVYVKDSPFCFGHTRPSFAAFLSIGVAYGVHMWDRMMHRKEMSRHVAGLRRGASAAQSLVKLNLAMGTSVEDQLERISLAMSNIDQLLVPSTINNFLNTKFILKNEREIISVFEDAQPSTLNWLISNVKLALVFYKVKDHRNFRGQHRTELIELLAVDRVSVLTIHSRALLLKALQLMKLPANPRAEHWVRNIILSTHQDELSDLKTMTDSWGDYFCMNKLIYDDIRSETVRQDILSHFKKEAAVQQAHMDMGTRKARLRMQRGWRKILSDVDDTLTSSGGSYPAGIDKRYNKRVVYPGVIGLYRELDLGIFGPDECRSNTGNLVFLSARPHLYKDMSEKHNFAKFKKLREREGVDGRGGLHTMPSLLAGDLTSGREFMMTGDFGPLALKKFDNFKRFVSIYPEFKHVFVCDNGQGDVRAGELIFDAFPRLLDGLFVHLVQDIQKTYGFDSERWRRKGLLAKTCFFTVYPDAAHFAAIQRPPFIRMSGLSRVCQDSIWDFNNIKDWASESQKRDRKYELNQSLWKCNNVLESQGAETVPLIKSRQQWEEGETVRTTYGIGVIQSFDAIWDLYEVELDLRPLDIQVKEFEEQEAAKKEAADARGTLRSLSSKINDRNPPLTPLAPVLEEDESNYMSPATSFDASKKSSKLSLAGMDQGVSTPAIDGELPGRSLPSMPESPIKHEFIFDADVFDERKSAASPVPTIDETIGTSITVDTTNNTKPVNSNVVTVAKEITGPKKSSPFEHGNIFARIQGKDITKYSPPIFPKTQVDKKSSFSWATGSVKGTVDTFVDKSKTKFVDGEKVTTPFGNATVVEHRHETHIVVVDMSGPWSARAYLQETIVRREGAGFFGSILRQFSTSQASPTRKRTIDQKFPHVVGSQIYSPYGEGTIIRALPVKEKQTPTKVQCTSSLGSNTIAVSLTSWTLSDGKHPTLYCVGDSIERWSKKQAANTPGGHSRDSSIFSIVSGLVSGTVESLKKIRVPREIETPAKVEQRKFERYYKDGAAVTTTFGDGIVRTFRETDGFYVVSLLMKSGKVLWTSYLREDSMNYRRASGVIEGYPCMTTFGSGVLQSVNPQTGVHNVVIPSFSAVCYLQPDQVLRPLKAAVYEDVSTPYGEGKVYTYRLSDNNYEIKLKWGNAMLYAKAETFDRIDDRLEDKGGFGVGWILRFFYTREECKEKEEDPSQRSRSNSFSMLSQSGVSLKSSLR